MRISCSPQPGASEQHQDETEPFSTTSASNFLSLNTGAAFSTTSANYWTTTNDFFSTTSSAYFLTVNQGPAFSTSSASFFLSQNTGTGFSTTSAAYFAHASTTIPKTYTANTFSALQTFGNASTTNISAAYASSTQGFFGSLSVGSLSGILKATTGAISSALVNLATDITGILPVGNGGTGWAAFASGAIPYGNGSSAIATTTAGTAGQVLALLNGVPTWTSTSTLATISGLLNLSSQITGALDVGNGGTGSTTLGGILKGNGTGQVASAVAGTDYVLPSSLFAYLFPSNATTTGLGIYASTTIGAGTQISGLTINGGATTTGNAYFTGNVGIGTPGPGALFDVKTGSNRHLGVRDNSPATQILGMTDGALGYAPLWIDGQTLVLNQSGGNVGIGTSSPVYGFDVYRPLFLRNAAATDNSSFGGVLITHTTSGTLTFQGASAEGLGTGFTSVFDLANQRVGISTSSPGSLLSIGNTTGWNFYENATSTSNSRGINLANGGCYAINGACIGSSASVSIGSAITGGTNGSVLFVNSGGLTQDNTNFFFDNTNKRLGLGTTTPWGQLSINPNGITGPSFVIGSSTATNFIVTSAGNVGVGTSTPIEALQVSGAIRATGQALSGTSNVTTIDYAGGTARFISSGSNVATMGSISLVQASANSSLINIPLFINSMGNIGIGTTTPNWNLQIAGTRPFRVLSDMSAGTNAKHWFETSQGGNFYIGTSSDALTATSTYLTIANGGNIGIGTTSPMSTLSVTGTLTTTRANNTDVGGTINIGGGAYKWQLIGNQVNAGDLMFNNPAGNAVLYMSQTGGSVGIGTTSPTRALEVGDGAGAKYIRLTGGGSGNNNGSMLLLANGGSDFGAVGNPSAYFGGTFDNSTGLFGYNGLKFYTLNSERMRIDTSGNVGIGTTSPVAKLQVYATGDCVDESSCNTLRLGSSAVGGMATYFGVNNTNSYSYIGSVKSGTAYSPLILNPSGGNVGIGTTSPNNKLFVASVGGVSINDSNLPVQISAGGGRHTSFLWRE